MKHDRQHRSLRWLLPLAAVCLLAAGGGTLLTSCDDEENHTIRWICAGDGISYGDYGISVAVDTIGRSVECVVRNCSDLTLLLENGTHRFSYTRNGDTLNVENLGRFLLRPVEGAVVEACFLDCARSEARHAYDYLFSQKQRSYCYHYLEAPKPLHLIENAIFLILDNNEGTDAFLASVAPYGNTSYYAEGTMGIAYIVAHRKEDYNAILSRADTCDHVRTYSPAFTTEYDDGLLGCIGKMTVCLDPGYSRQQLEETLAGLGGHIYNENAIASEVFYYIEFPGKDGLKALTIANLMNALDMTVSAQPKWVEWSSPCSSDPYYANQWNLDNTGQSGGTAGIDINADSAWGITVGDSSIVVAVVDNGVELNHPDLLGNLVPGFDEMLHVTGTNTEGGPLTLAESHGTMCAGIIAAVQDNNVHISGVAPKCKIMPIRIPLNHPVHDVVERKIAAIKTAKNNGAHIISNSWIHRASNHELSTTIIDAATTGRGGYGCVIVFSSGNGNQSQVEYPSSLEEVIAVGAINRQGWRSRIGAIGDSWPNGESLGSSHGLGLSVVAPGTNVWSLTTGHGYVSNFSGTSAAAPHVAGVAALMLSVNPHLTAAEVKFIIESTAKKLPNYTFSPSNNAHPNGTWNTEVGYGLLDAYAAVKKSMYRGRIK